MPLKTSKIIPHSRPWITSLDIKSVEIALKKKSVSCYQYCEKLVEVLKEQAGFINCRLNASGTLSLLSALNGLGLPKGSGIAIPSFTCHEVLDAVLASGYIAVPVDCDQSGIMKAEEVSDKFSKHKISAVIAVHQFGILSIGMNTICMNLPVIEDCCHVPPKKYLEKSFAVIGSFEGTKLLGAGEGGYLLTNLKHQIPSVAGDNGFSDIVASIALSQLCRLRKNLSIREKIAVRFKKAIRNHEVLDSSSARISWMRFLVRTSGLAEINSLIEKAQIHGIILRRPIMPSPIHRMLKLPDSSFPNTVQLCNTLLSIPLYPDLNESEISIIENFLADNL